jgi:hypothetical protein
MFHNHQTRIGRFARAKAENMAKVATFVILTVQAPLKRIPGDMATVAELGYSAPCIWGFKHDALRFWRQHAEEAYDRLQALWLDPGLSHAEFDQEALEYVAALPGFGLVKGGFFLQLCYGRVGCLDTHNIARFNLAPRHFCAARFKGAKQQATKARVVGEYILTCENLGGAAALWDGWCEYVAKNDPYYYPTAQEASALHCEALGLEA